MDERKFKARLAGETSGCQGSSFSKLTVENDVNSFVTSRKMDILKVILNI
jgi:hypothetical protein